MDMSSCTCLASSESQPCANVLNPATGDWASAGEDVGSWIEIRVPNLEAVRITKVVMENRRDGGKTKKESIATQSNLYVPNRSRDEQEPADQF